MNRFFYIISALFICLQHFAQLKDIKIMIPREIAYSYYDFVQFLPNENYFVTCGDALSVYNTETSEILDEYDLISGAKNLSVSNNGKYILVSVNNEILIFTFNNQKLELYLTLTAAELLKDFPMGQYYGALPFGGCFFTNQNNRIYASIGSFTLVYDFLEKKIISTHSFALASYIMHSGVYAKKQEAIIAKSTATISTLLKQKLNNLADTFELIKNPGTLMKLRVRDSLAICLASDKYFIINLETNKVVYEIRAPKIKYDGYYQYDTKYLTDLNKRTSFTPPDTVNFSADEYVFDMDFIPKTGEVVVATAKGLKFINLKTKKINRKEKGFCLNIKVSSAGNRLICNSYTPNRSLRIYDPSNMHLISERLAMGNVVYHAGVSPNKHWMFTNCGATCFIWDLRNFSKYAEIKDISKQDSAHISDAFFLNDSEVVINSGKGDKLKNLNLYTYNLRTKKYGKLIKKGVHCIASGFIKGEFYYADYQNLYIINLKTGAEEKYPGLFSMASLGTNQVINFTKNLVFVPDAGKFKIVNRHTKKTEYENPTWSVNSSVVISDDEKYIYTTAQITKKINFSGTDVDIPTSAIVKIDMAKKQIVQDYANSYYFYNFKLKNESKKIAIWYIKHDIKNNNPNEKELLYSEYETDSGKELFTKTLDKTRDIIPFQYAGETGKYIAFSNHMGNYFKIFDDKGDLVIDAGDIKLPMPKCFFDEGEGKLIATSYSKSLVTFIDLKNKKITGQLANASGDQFFLITSDLYYMGSKEFVKNLRFKHQTEIYSFEQFDAYLNQPHRVLRAFSCSDSALIQAYETAYLKRMKVLGLSNKNKINFSVLPSFQYVKMQEDKNGKVNFSISANKGKNNITQLEVYNNASLVHSENISEAQGAKFEKNLSFETSSGINRFEFIIKDKEGFESPRLVRMYNNTDIVKPNLYLVVVASEKFKDKRFDLAYAVKDASDMANTMAESKSFNKIEIKKLFNQSFTADSVVALKNFFAKAGVNDVVMVFFAGHGYLDTDLSYYFPTYYTDFTDPKINAVAYTNFEKLFKEMKPLRKLMFIDACFSGEVDDEDVYFEDENPDSIKDSTRAALNIARGTFAQSTALEMSKSIFSDIRQSSGATIISSAGGTEAALEGEKWNNGLFTHCLLSAMKNLKADSNNDKKVSLSELQKYVAEEVYRLSDGRQSPTYRMENSVLDYELW